MRFLSLSFASPFQIFYNSARVRSVEDIFDPAALRDEGFYDFVQGAFLLSILILEPIFRA